VNASKVTAAHLARRAYLYVRQSTQRQVLTNTESAQRQYVLRQKAVALGWPDGQVVTIDADQGQSGASSQDREGFKFLVAEVGLGNAGIVCGLEVSRLARNNADWQRLLEICALTGTLICDEDGLYDPADFNDRLLLGLKGTMSEAELHVIRARLVGGQRSKARRGELRLPLPAGLVYDGADHVVLDPDAQVQGAIRRVFDTFARTGSACAVVKQFADDGLLIPCPVRSGERKGELVWSRLNHSRVLSIVHNPGYAGAFAYGRHRQARTVDGKTTLHALPRDQWMALIRDHHPGYVTFEQWEANQDTLSRNAAARGPDRAGGPAREGPALLQGLAVCGKCGRRMTVRYHRRAGREFPDYQCVRQTIDTGCESLPGRARRGGRRGRRGAPRRQREARIRAAVEDFGALWADPATPDRERKRVARLLVEDVTLVKTDQATTAQVRLRGGQARSLEVPLPLSVADQRRTDPAAVARADKLLEEHTDRETAELLNAEGITTGLGRPFDRVAVVRLRGAYQLASHAERLHGAGWLTLAETAARYDVHEFTVKNWEKAGLVASIRVNDKNERYYQPPEQDPRDLPRRRPRPKRKTTTTPRSSGGAV
jgi:DNA invertase Pin-like site-specific DNA recombinase